MNKPLRYYIEDIIIFLKHKLYLTRKTARSTHKNPFLYEAIGIIFLFFEARIGIIFILFGMLYNDYKAGTHRYWHDKARFLPENTDFKDDENVRNILSEINRISYRVKNLREEFLRYVKKG